MTDAGGVHCVGYVDYDEQHKVSTRCKENTGGLGRFLCLVEPSFSFAGGFGA